ncbi:MAG: heat-shock protein Hsp33 [Haloplasmataceae bacterium]|jgi:molecular chaperone Hsp33|nr:heat-shock protein Hsp33 [Haloplasmataceae bacterium]
MTDYIVRAISFDNKVRIFAVNATKTVQSAQEKHDLWPVASAALGRTLVVGSMMGAMLKGDEALTIRIKGDGPIGEILVDANAHGEVKGYVGNPHIHFQYPNGKLDVSSAVGKNGEIQVIKDLGMKDFFISSVDLISGELGEDFTYYFSKSEQTPSAVGCGVFVDTDNKILAAGGFIIQLMPGATDEIIDKLEKVIATIKPASQMISEGYSPETIVKEICNDEDFEIISTLPIDYVCRCNKDKFARGLISIGKQELSEILEEVGMIETTCHFCNEKYHFNREELEELISNSR